MASVYHYFINKLYISIKQLLAINIFSRLNRVIINFFQEISGNTISADYLRETQKIRGEITSDVIT